jgi:hypothetical protein
MQCERYNPHNLYTYSEGLDRALQAHKDLFQLDINALRVQYSEESTYSLNANLSN